MIEKTLRLGALASAFILLTAATRASVPNLCFENSHKNLLDDNDYAMRLPVSALESGSAQPIVESYLKLQEYFQNFGPWLLQDVSHPAISLAAFNTQGILAQRMIDRLMLNGNAVDILKRAAAGPAHYSESARQQSEILISKLNALPVDPQVADIRPKAILFCAPFFDVGCVGAFKDVLDIMSPRIGGAAYISMLPVVRRILLDDSLVQGSAHFALKILDRIKSKNWRSQNDLHLLEDIKESFIATGSTPQQASDRAWTLIAMYGTRGASLSFFSDLANYENLPVFLNLYIFSSTLGLLDSATFKSGSPYSYPPNVRTQCAYRTPYHFWLTAYLTKLLVARGYSERSAAIATHLTAKLYEFASNSVTRTPDRPYTDKFFNHYNLMIQANMAFTDAGAFFGAGAKRIIDVDKGMGLIIDAGKPMPELSPAELEAGLKNPITKYGWFNRVIAGDTWLKNAFAIQETEGGGVKRPDQHQN